MSSFRGIDFFGSGPHRVVQGARAQTLVPLWIIAGIPYDDAGGTESQGDRDATVRVDGRLVGATEGDLFGVRDALAQEARFAQPEKAGVLVDNDGRSWPGLVLVEYAETGPVDRGRVWSVGYVATFREVTSRP